MNAQTCSTYLNIDKYPFCLKDLKDNDPQRWCGLQMSIKSTPLVKSKSVQDLVDLCLRGPGLVRHFGTGENIVLHLQFFGKKEGWTHKSFAGDSKHNVRPMFSSCVWSIQHAGRICIWIWVLCDWLINRWNGKIAVQALFRSLARCPKVCWSFEQPEILTLREKMTPQPCCIWRDWSSETAVAKLCPHACSTPTKMIMLARLALLEHALF